MAPMPPGRLAGTLWSSGAAMPPRTRAGPVRYTATAATRGGAGRGAPAGVRMKSLQEFIEEHRVTEVECLVPDMNGIARGKILPDDKFIKGLGTRGMRIPESIFVQTVTGDYPEDEDVTDDA